MTHATKVRGQEVIDIDKKVFGEQESAQPIETPTQRALEVFPEVNPEMAPDKSV